jgi:hypothetical protein
MLDTIAGRIFPANPAARNYGGGPLGQIASEEIRDAPTTALNLAKRL